MHVNESAKSRICVSLGLLFALPSGSSPLDLHSLDIFGVLCYLFSIIVARWFIAILSHPFSHKAFTRSAL